MPSKKTALLVAAVLAAALTTVAVAATPFHGSTGRMVRISSSGEVGVANTAGMRATVRARYVVPAKWRRMTSLRARSIRFDTRNSCRHRVTFTPRMVMADEVPAAQRAAELAPAPNPNLVQAEGTREGAGFRVVRTRGSSDLTGVLVQPLPQRDAGAGAQRVYAELHARATYDRRTDCHSGGPRTVGDAIGDAFGAGGAGGFVRVSSSG